MYRLEDYANITNTLEMVTPEIAKAWLSLNRKENRNLKKSGVKAIAEDIKNGNWKAGTDSIGFDTEGMLCNGQHRLSAIVESGIAVPCFVRRGLPTESLKIIDSGRSRTMRDRTKISGLHADTPVFSALNSVIKYIYDETYKKSGTGLTLDAASEIYERFPNIFAVIYDMTCTLSGEAAKPIRNRFFQVALLAALCNGISQRRCQAFIDCIVKKEFTDAQVLGCDFKIALNYERDYLTRISNRCGGSRTLGYEIPNRALYCFVQGKKKTTISMPYKFDEGTLVWLENRLIARKDEGIA